MTNSIMINKYHEKYSLIFEEQRRLPNRKGKKDYTDLELKIKSMARELKLELFVFKENNKGEDNSNNLVIDNIVSGCERLIENPYKRF